MPVINHLINSSATVSLNVERRGWNDGVIITIESPRPVSWYDLAGDDYEIAEQNWDGVAVIDGIITITNETSGNTLYESIDYEGAYSTFIGFPMNADDEVTYGSTNEFSVGGFYATFNFGEALEPITVEISEALYYRQIDDTESWGSEHMKSLFIPRQNPVP